VIAVGNLVDAILRAVETPVEEARPGVYPVADEGTVSTADILRWLREGMGRRPGLLPVPVSMMTMPMTAIGKGQMAQSLFGDLVVDTRRFTATFGWHAPVTSVDAIRSAGAGFGKEGHGDGR
jgi:nucleoside-diphosphate-sugar epimerase